MIIRDPVFGDIQFTENERKVIDTQEVQRLRGVKQLGTAYLVYPGATHTRFSHSLGVLHMAETIIKICNENQAKYGSPDLLSVNPYERFIIRLFALLHDVAHIPFGHTLEREGNLFEKHEWDDKDRAEKILGDESEIRKVITKTLQLFIKIFLIRKM